MITAISLREIPGVEPAHLHFPGASHEFLALALDPTGPLPNLHQNLGENGSKYLQPIDQCHQVILKNDADAEHLLSVIARACCDGVLVPDQDHRSRWAEALASTAEHLRLGEHPDGAHRREF